MRYKRALQLFHFVHRSECRLMLIHESLMGGNRSTHKKNKGLSVERWRVRSENWIHGLQEMKDTCYEMCKVFQLKKMFWIDKTVL